MYKQKLALNCFLHLRFDFLDYRKYKFNWTTIRSHTKPISKVTQKYLKNMTFTFPWN